MGDESNISHIACSPSVNGVTCVKKHVHILARMVDTGEMESTIVVTDPKTVLTSRNVARTAALFTAPILLSVLTEARFVPLALLTTLIGLALVSIRKSAAEGNRSTTENIVIASLLIFAATVWGYFIAGAAVLVVPVLAVLVTRGTAKRPVEPTAPDSERVLVRH